MKKIILLSVLSIIFITGTAVASEVNAFTAPPTGIWIKLQIVFHRPKMDCERGFGICAMFSWGTEEKQGMQGKDQYPAKGQFNERNQLLIEVREADLEKNGDGSALNNFRGRSEISIPDPYALPEATCRALGSGRPLIIKPGNYPISCRNGIYTMVFQF